MALSNDKNTIIAVPFISLVLNKVEQHNGNVLGVYGETDQKDIEEYILTHTTKKIMVTYNSLPRIIYTLEKFGYNAYKDFFLLVDEWHVLFNSYVFRKHAIKDVLEEAPKFDAVTYMTATPIEDKYMFKEFRHLPIVEVE